MILRKGNLGLALGASATAHGALGVVLMGALGANTGERPEPMEVTVSVEPQIADDPPLHSADPPAPTRGTERQKARASRMAPPPKAIPLPRDIPAVAGSSPGPGPGESGAAVTAEAASSLPVGGSVPALGVLQPASGHGEGPPSGPPGARLPPRRDLVRLSGAEPIYPPTARRSGDEGVVRLRIDVAPDGSVRGATVVKADPAGVFDEAALRAVRSWRFTPRADASTAEMDVVFRLTVR